jgi:hypothetical protein
MPPDPEETSRTPQWRNTFLQVNLIPWRVKTLQTLAALKSKKHTDPKHREIKTPKQRRKRVFHAKKQHCGAEKKGECLEIHAT